MNKRAALSLMILFSVLSAGICTTWTITNSGTTFTPDTLTIVFGDDVDFSLGSTHNVLEVSQETWDANGTDALASGFSTPFGGGSVSTDLLTVGTHWYVCTQHAALGMKGVIIVEAATTLAENRPGVNVSFYPNPVYNLITIRSNVDLAGSPYSFTDLTGKLILRGRLDDESVTVDLSSFESGIYLLQIGDRRRRAFKIIKK